MATVLTPWLVTFDFINAFRIQFQVSSIYGVSWESFRFECEGQQVDRTSLAREFNGKEILAVPKLESFD